jgi:hypothetical protein
MKIPEKTIKDIAQEFDCGLRVFLHKTTQQYIAVPDEDLLIDDQEEAWKNAFEILEKNANNYYEIEKWCSSEAFNIMQDFTNQLKDNTQIKVLLLEALEKRKPFREFKFLIDEYADYRNDWFAFKNAQQEQLVKEQIENLEL